MLKVSIIHIRDLRRQCGLNKKDVRFCFLCEDYEGFAFAKKAWPLLVSFDQLDADFSTVYADVKRELLSAWGELNARYSSFAWWCGQLASKNVGANAFAERVVHYFRAKRVIMDNQRAIIFVVDSPALAGMVADLARKAGRPVEDRLYWERLAVVCFSLVWARIVAKCAIVAWGIINRIMAARHIPYLRETVKAFQGRVVLLRTWITEGNFDKAGKFRERNFGDLSEWFLKKDTMY